MKHYKSIEHAKELFAIGFQEYQTGNAAPPYSELVKRSGWEAAQQLSIAHEYTQTVAQAVHR